MVQPLGSVDKLYFNRRSWDKLSEFGVIPDETIFKVGLVSTERKSTFPKRDVIDERTKL